jgi:hypothetical protein
MGVLLSRLKSLGSIVVLGIGVSLLAGCGGPGDISGQVATVNGDSISSKDYYNYLQRKSSVTGITQQGQKVIVSVPPNESLGFQALRDLVVDKIILQIAKEQGVYPTEAEVAAELKFQQGVADLNGGTNIVQAALSRGFTTESFKGQILVDLCKSKIISKGITITPTQVDDWIKQHPDSSLVADPPKITALMLLVPAGNSTMKAAADDELKKGRPFQLVAQQYSQDPEREKYTYHYHEIEVPRMPAVLQQLLQKTEVNQATDWQQANEGWVKFFVEKKQASHKKDTKNPVLLQIISRGLAEQQGLTQHGANYLNQLIEDKLKAAKESAIQIMPKAYQENWKDFMTQVLKAKTPTPAPGAPAGGAPAGGATTAGAAPAGATTGAAPSGATSGAAPAGAPPAGAPPAGATNAPKTPGKS